MMPKFIMVYNHYCHPHRWAMVLFYIFFSMETQAKGNCRIFWTPIFYLKGTHANSIHISLARPINGQNINLVDKYNSPFPMDKKKTGNTATHTEIKEMCTKCLGKTLCK
jgi:hypothetical protein